MRERLGRQLQQGLLISGPTLAQPNLVVIGLTTTSVITQEAGSFSLKVLNQ